jgi:hypothetical protein
LEKCVKDYGLRRVYYSWYTAFLPRCRKKLLIFIEFLNCVVIPKCIIENFIIYYFRIIGY